jgi:adenylate cyclase
LLDAETDAQVWADRYDRELKDIFAIQDEVTSAIVATLSGRVEAAAHERVKRKQTDNLAAYECVVTGKVLHHRSTREANVEALRMLDRAIALDPRYAHAHAWRGCVIGQTWAYGWCEDKDLALKKVGEALDVALSLDENDADVHRILTALNVNLDNLDKAAYHQERALALNPNNDLIVVQQGELLTWLGRAEEGAEWVRRAMRLNPYHPQRYWSHLGRAHYTARAYADALEAFSRISSPDYSHHAFLAAASAQLGNAVAARAHADEVLAREPHFAIPTYLASQHYRQQADRDHLAEGLAKAGLPK